MPEVQQLNKGSKEFIIVDVTDRLGNLTDLAGTNPLFDARLQDSATWVEQNSAVTIDGLRAFCLIDTANYPEGEYELFLKFTIAPEAPKLGPFLFAVNA